MDQLLFSKENSHALVIGIGKRPEDNDIMQITASDAELLSRELEKRCPFLPANIRRITNDDSTSANVLEQLDQIAKLTAGKPASMVLLYFSGHGCKIGDEYFLVCRNTTNNNIRGSAINGNELVKKLEAINTEKMLILLDCCHSGGVAVADNPADIPFEAGDFLSNANRIVLTASHASKVSFVCKPVSLFTYAVVEGLAGKYFQDGDKNVTIFDLAMYVRERVASLSQSRQQPQLSILNNTVTNNFALASYESKPGPGFSNELVLKNESGKDIDLSATPARDDTYRQSFTVNSVVIKQGDNNNNVIIQDVKESSIIVNINGETKEIKAVLSELRELMQKLNERTLTVSGTSYNINDLTENNFALLTGRTAFNEVFIRRLLESAGRYDPDAKELCEMAKENHGDDWPSIPEVRESAIEIFTKLFPGILSGMILKLIAIGTEDYADQKQLNSKQERYIKNIQKIAMRSLQLLCFAFLSKFWDYKNSNDYKLSQEESTIFRSFFDTKLDYTNENYLKLLETLIRIFSTIDFPPPVDEVNELNECLQPDSEFRKAFAELKKIGLALNKSQFNLLDCSASEMYLSIIMDKLSFLSKYKMVSIKGIDFYSIRGSVPSYQHNYSYLSDESSSQLVVDKINFVAEPITTHAILFYKGDHYQEGVNLSPFIIDLNALTGDVGTKIHFYVRRVLQSKLKYSFLKDDSDYFITYANLPQTPPDINDILNDEQKKTQFKLDNIFRLIEKAKETVLK